MNEEVKALVEYRMQQARDAREEAEILFERGKYRGALNRVYYSMFYAVLALLASRELTASKHSGVIYLFHREFVKTEMIPLDVAKFLDIAFDLRNKCDYRDFVTPDFQRVAELLKQSEVFIDTVKATLERH